jgi:hypothetical protein
MNAMKTVAAVCIPSVSAKISMENPNRKPNTNASQAGVSKGNSIINKI